jgi:hypothetical protein
VHDPKAFLKLAVQNKWKVYTDQAPEIVSASEKFTLYHL